MLIQWKVRYLDRKTKQFGDRNLYLETLTLDALTRATVELAVEAKTEEDRRKFLRCRPLFIEDNTSKTFDEWRANPTDGFRGDPLFEYFEDETGQEISFDDMAKILTGNPDAIFISKSLKQFEIDLKLAKPKLIPFDKISLSNEDLAILGYFARDFQELSASAFMKENVGRLVGPFHSKDAPSDPRVETSVTDEEIRSFVTIFRRLYMEKEPASFKKAAEVFTNSIDDHPYGGWVAGIVAEYEAMLAKTPEIPPFIPARGITFTTKRLIDVFLYTQYAHQPDDKRRRQFDECLAALDGKRGLMTWLFLGQMHACGLEIGNAGRPILRFLNGYCQHHKVSTDVLNSLLDDHPGIGKLEKEADRKARRFEEQAQQLADRLWKQAAEPAAGPASFLESARQQLRKAME